MFDKKRSCGGCTACCTALGIHKFNKPPGVACNHECAGGCNIYNTRPQECVAFRCGWLDKMFEPEDRPDMTGLVPVPVQQRERRIDGRRTLVVYESVPGASRTDAGINLLRQALDEGWIVCVLSSVTKPEGQFHISKGLPQVKQLIAKLRESGEVVNVHL